MCGGVTAANTRMGSVEEGTEGDREGCWEEGRLGRDRQSEKDVLSLAGRLSFCSTV